MENPVHSRGACFPDPAPRFVRQVANVLKEMDVSRIRDAVARLCVSANRALPRDVSSALAAARDVEDGPVARDILDTIVENARMADPVPICQDTGMACVFLEVGQDVHLTGGSLRTAVDAGVAQGYSEGYLRKSLVSDPLERKNTGDNTPAMLYVDIVPGSAVTVTVAPKGAGTENMSQIAMLRPSDGAAGVMDFVLDTVEKAILFYRDEGITGERFADTIARLGFTYVEDKLLNSKIDKETILQKTVIGGAKC